MNRSQRRAYSKANKGRYFINTGTADIKDGSEFTIKGVMMLKEGGFITDCQPGRETVFIASSNPLGSAHGQYSKPKQI